MTALLQHISTLTVTSKGQIVIPKEMRERFIGKDRKLAILSFGDHLEIRKFDDVARFLAEKGKIAPLMSATSSAARRWNTPEEDKAWKGL